MPGVYLMRDPAGTILYIGKARNLRSRVRSYFGKGRDSRYHIQFLMSRVSDIEYIVTDTEKEALILENTLIKQHRPRYNINLRDDKTYFSLRMDMREEFPRLNIVRKVPRDGARYFGPYASGLAAREVLKQLYKIFPLRHYPLETCRQRRRPCLFYQIRQCSAPCHGLISREAYADLAEGAALFLEGKNTELLKVLKQRMHAAAADQSYEEAGRYRDLIRNIETTLEKQKMVTGAEDTDVIGYCRLDNRLWLTLLYIRGGSMIGSRHFEFDWEMEDGEGIHSFLNQYYGREVYVPAEVLLPLPIDDATAVAELLGEMRGRRVTVTYPRRGTKGELVKLANRNAETAAREKMASAENMEQVLTELQQRLHLHRMPRRIECFDISTIQGQNAVGSGIAFCDGKPDKDRYRKYRIRTVGQADDFAMMHEVLTRRFSRGKAEGDLPDLIVVDGGIGQLNILLGVLAELGISGVDVAALAKSRVTREMTGEELQRSEERVFLPGRKNPVVLRQNSAPLLLLAHIRDEAHRFAITYHKKLRGRETISSELANVPGIGEKRGKELLRQFGSLKNIREASVDELAAVRGMSRRAAEALWQHLHKGET